MMNAGNKIQARNGSRLVALIKAYSDRISSLFHNQYSAWCVLLVSLLLTLFASHLTNRHIGRRIQDRFDFKTVAIRDRIEERMLEYEQVLRGGVALFQSSENVTREEWQSYIENCQIQRFFPGIQAIGYAIPVAPADKADHERRIREEGFDSYVIRPNTPRDSYSSIIYIEPFDWRNQRAFGYDMYSEPNRRRAMRRAVDTGLPSISNRITLVQETEVEPQVGILCYLPLYEPTAVLNTVADRKRAVKGWVYAAFRCDDLMHEIVGRDTDEVSFRIYDSTDVDPDRLLFEEMHAVPSKETTLSSLLPLHVGGQDWTLQFGATPKFISTQDASQSLVVAGGGLIIDLLLFVVLTTLTRQRESAKNIAQQMTLSFRESEARTRSIFHNASETIFCITTLGKITAANKAAAAMFEATNLEGSDLNNWLYKVTFEEIKLRLSNEEKRCEHEMQCRTSSGRKFHCNLSIAHVDESAYGTGYVVIVRDETARRKAALDLAEANHELVRASHMAGVAEVATGVLHNVGNALNSVSTSSEEVRRRLNEGAAVPLSKAMEVIDAYEGSLVEFLQQHPRGEHFPEFLAKLSAALLEERNAMLGESDRLRSHVQHIREIIRVQQDQAKTTTKLQRESLAELIEQAILLCQSRKNGRGIDVKRDFADCPMILTDANKVLQILLNFLGNAQDAVNEVNDRAPAIRIQTEYIDEQYIAISVADNGVGMSDESLEKISSFGFTTKVDGHGFGLHSSKLAAESLGGEIQISSGGVNLGACFKLILPLDPSEIETSDNEEQQGECVGHLAV